MLLIHLTRFPNFFVWCNSLGSYGRLKGVINWKFDFFETYKLSGIIMSRNWNKSIYTLSAYFLTLCSDMQQIYAHGTTS